MKLIVAGSRSITHHGTLARAIESTKIKPTKIIIGNAKGVDTLAENYAAIKEIPCEIVDAPWDLYGRPAGHVRNERITNDADALLAIWDGQSNGTKELITMMNKKNKTVFLYLVQDNEKR